MGCITYNTNYYYDLPLLSIKGETKLKAPSATNPTTPSEWEPIELVTAGPVLLKDGKIPFDFTRTSKGNTYFLSNWEMITNDVFTNTTGDDWRCDRSAVGITPEGNLIFFACEGRTPSLSCGANLDEVARILKALGCVEALNFDGGGSTKLYLGGQSFSNNNRAVVTTVGIVTK
jgi:exopolysaccharide biosynthesis protein